MNPSRRDLYTARFRLLSLLGLFLSALFLLSGCQDWASRFELLCSESVGGRTYVLVETWEGLFQDDPVGSFGIYRDKTENGSAWEEVVQNRQGPVLGTFVYERGGSQQLGVLHPDRVSLYDFSGEQPQSKNVSNTFEWMPETGAQLGDGLFVFGGIFPKQDPDDRSEEARARARIGHVGIARFDDQTFRELKLDSFPRLDSGGLGFWLKAVYHQGKIHLFWRGYDGTMGIDMEPPMHLSGPLQTIAFNGESFEFPIRSYSNLPLGLLDVWSDGQRIRMVAQPQNKKFGRTAHLRLFTLTESEAVEDQWMEEPEHKIRLRMKHYKVFRLAKEDADIFLRTNSQAFEIWRNQDQRWTIGTHPVGLPQNHLERLILSIMALCVLTVAAGIGMAFRRRKQMQMLIRKLQPNDVLAPMGLRISAYLIDLGLIGLLAELLSRLLDLPNAGIIMNLLLFPILHPYFGCYLLYLTFLEWGLGATVGKWVLGLRVVTSKGERPTFWSAVVRNFVGFYERNIVLAAFAALPTIMLTPRHQRLGDLLARTLVVQKSAMDRFVEQRIQGELDVQEGTTDSGARKDSATVEGEGKR